MRRAAHGQLRRSHWHLTSAGAKLPPKQKRLGWGTRRTQRLQLEACIHPLAVVRVPSCGSAKVALGGAEDDSRKKFNLRDQGIAAGSTLNWNLEVRHGYSGSGSVNMNASTNSNTIIILAFLLGAILLAGGPLAGQATGATWYVNNGPTGSDSNSCLIASRPCATISEAMNKAASGDTIQIAPNTYPGGFTISKDLTLKGTGRRTVILGGSPVLTVALGITATLRNLTITGSSALNGGIHNFGTLSVANCILRENGPASTGGGIYNAGTLDVTNTTFSGNSAFEGGAIYNGDGGVLTVTGCALSSNSATFGGGIMNELRYTFKLGTVTVTDSIISGIAFRDQGGGISNFGGVTVVNSTVSGNYATESRGFGAGILNYGSATLVMVNSTVSGNSALAEGGGIQNINTSIGSASLSNVLLAGNQAAAYPDCIGTLSDGSGGHNLVGIGDGCGLANGVNGAIVGTASSPVNPLLGSLFPNGGPTLTLALQAQSPAIGMGDVATCLSRTLGVDNKDQRGFQRNTRIRRACDIGAYDTGGTR